MFTPCAPLPTCQSKYVPSSCGVIVRFNTGNTMKPKQAACDPCRKAKLACGHEQPVCARCVLRHKKSICVYRASPFKRTRLQTPLSSPAPEAPHNCREPHQPPELQSPSTSTPGHNRYPNPGFLGLSSHVAIYNHILSEDNASHDAMAVAPPSASLHEHPSARQGALLMKELLSLFDLNDLISLVTYWRATGANLTGAEPFVDLCADLGNYNSLSTFQSPEWHLEFSAQLLQNTTRPLNFSAQTTVSTYSAQFLGSRSRWETLGIFLSAAIQATRDVSFYPSLYNTSSGNRELRRLLTRLNDCALDICLSADCLNDLQLVLQYENFIIHSYVDGDQSKY